MCRNGTLRSRHTHAARLVAGGHVLVAHVTGKDDAVDLVVLDDPRDVVDHVVRQAAPLVDHGAVLEGALGEAAEDGVLARRVHQLVRAVAHHVHGDDRAPLLFQPGDDLPEVEGLDVVPEHADLLIRNLRPVLPHAPFRIVDHVLVPGRLLRIAGPQSVDLEEHGHGEDVAVGGRYGAPDFVVLLPQRVPRLVFVDDLLEPIHIECLARVLGDELDHLLHLVGIVVDGPVIVAVRWVGGEDGDVAPVRMVHEGRVPAGHAVTGLGECEIRGGDGKQSRDLQVQGQADQGAAVARNGEAGRLPPGLPRCGAPPGPLAENNC